MQETTEQGRRRGPSAFRCPPSAFTLVELLVVIAIIGVLTALLLPAAMNAAAAGKRNRIVAEITQFATALEDYKNNVGSYPPNAQVDGGGTTSTTPLDDSKTLSEFKRHFLKAFPQHQEPPALIEALVGQSSNTNISNGGATNLANGMNAAEAMVFWMSEFSDDPKYPISGSGGPSYRVQTATPAHQQDSPESRKWRLDINIQQLHPRGEDGFFPASYSRFVTYTDPRDGTTTRRINFWYLKASGSPAPYLYFDASRGSSVTAQNDAPAASRPNALFQYTGPDADTLNELFFVYSIKARKSNAAANNPYRFANDGKFQILHPGLDESWGVFPMVNPNDTTQLINSQQYHVNTVTVELPLLSPEGPWTLELADTLASFTNGTLESAQP